MAFSRPAAQSSGRAVEVRGHRTETQQSFAEADGSPRMTISAVRRRVRTADRARTAIDTRLRATKARPAQVATPVTFSPGVPVYLDPRIGVNRWAYTNSNRDDDLSRGGLNPDDSGTHNFLTSTMQAWANARTSALLNDGDPGDVVMARYEYQGVSAGGAVEALSDTGGTTIPHTLDGLQCR